MIPSDLFHHFGASFGSHFKSFVDVQKTITLIFFIHTYLPWCRSVDDFVDFSVTWFYYSSYISQVSSTNRLAVLSASRSTSISLMKYHNRSNNPCDNPGEKYPIWFYLLLIWLCDHWESVWHVPKPSLYFISAYLFRLCRKSFRDQKLSHYASVSSFFKKLVCC